MIKGKYTKVPPWAKDFIGPRGTFSIGPAYGFGMWRKEKLCAQWKSRVIPFAIGHNTLQQDTRAERGLSVYSAIILEKGRARGLKLCNYYTRRKKQHRTLHICTKQLLFLNFLNQYSKQDSMCPERRLLKTSFWLSHCRMCSSLCDASSCMLERWFDMLHVQHVDWVLLHLVQITFLFEGILYSF